ncbi:MAG: peptidylprolyl isomerase [Planctomycetota bacterium]|jgi:cyclophilin family peptidyl-prolyl cis-trans isomerase
MPIVRLTLAAVVLAAIVITGPAGAQESTMTGTDAPRAADAALEPILGDFQNLYESLRNQRGMVPEDKAIVRGLRDRAAAFNDQWPDHPKGVACELQLTMWLKEQDRVDALFERLVTLVPDDSRIGLAWVNYFRQLGETDRAEEISRELLDIYPGNQQVRLGWVSYLKASNRYEEAIEFLTSEPLDLVEVPQAALTLSECLFAEQRYVEALEALDSIPQEGLANNPFVNSQISQDRPVREEYIGLWEQEQAIRQAEAEADDLPRVELTLDHGRIVVELFENEAPNTVANFITLVESGFYDETKFHRVVPNFMAQGGDPNTKPDGTGGPGEGGPGYRIPDEHTGDIRRNHFTGSLAMAKTAPPDTAGSQFFITHRAPPWLNGKHTVFGRVIEGLDVARAIKPDDVLRSAKVLRKRDHEYTPETLTETAAVPDATKPFRVNITPDQP